LWTVAQRVTRRQLELSTTHRGALLMAGFAMSPGRPTHPTIQSARHPPGCHGVSEDNSDALAAIPRHTQHRRVGRRSGPDLAGRASTRVSQCPPTGPPVRGRDWKVVQSRVTEEVAFVDEVMPIAEARVVATGASEAQGRAGTDTSFSISASSWATRSLRSRPRRSTNGVVLKVRVRRARRSLRGAVGDSGSSATAATWALLGRQLPDRGQGRPDGRRRL